MRVKLGGKKMVVNQDPFDTVVEADVDKNINVKPDCLAPCPNRSGCLGSQDVKKVLEEGWGSRL